MGTAGYSHRLGLIKFVIDILIITDNMFFSLKQIRMEIEDISVLTRYLLLWFEALQGFGIMKISKIWRFDILN